MNKKTDKNNDVLYRICANCAYYEHKGHGDGLCHDHGCWLVRILFMHLDAPKPVESIDTCWRFKDAKGRGR